MEFILDVFQIFIVLVIGSFIFYKIIPFRNIYKQPGLTFFPKYEVNYSTDLAQVKSILEKHGFIEKSRAPDAITLVRGELLNFLSIETMELRINIIDGSRTMQLYSPWMLLFETGKIWKIVHAVTEEKITSELLRLTKVLDKNNNWPFEITGQLEVTKCGYYSKTKFPPESKGYIDTNFDGIRDIRFETVSAEVYNDSNINIDEMNKVSILVDIPREDQKDDFNRVIVGSDKVYEIIKLKVID